MRGHSTRYLRAIVAPWPPILHAADDRAIPTESRIGMQMGLGGGQRADAGRSPSGHVRRDVLSFRSMNDLGLAQLLGDCDHVYSEAELKHKLEQSAREKRPLRVKL